MFPEAVRNLCKQRDAGFKRRKLASMSLRLVTLSSFLLGILLMSGGHGALCWLNSTRDYAYMRRVTNNNYSHFLRDIIWRSVLRDWPTRPVRLERWITDRDPTFFMALEQGSQLQFELAPEPSKLFEWDSCTDICGKYFEQNCSTTVTLGSSFRPHASRTGGERSNFQRIVWLSRGKFNSRRAIFDERQVFDQVTRVIASEKTLGLSWSTEFMEVTGANLKNGTLSSQAQLFSDADVLVSLHGAGLANMLFMRPGSFIVEIMPGEYDKPTYRELSRNLGHDYRRVQTRNAKPSLFTKIFYALDKAADRERKLKRDAIVYLTSDEILNICRILIARLKSAL